MAGHVGGDQASLRADASGQQGKDNHSPDKSFHAPISPTSVWHQLSHTALNLRNPCGGGSIILLRQRMIAGQYSRRPARQQAALAPDISLVVTTSTPTCATRLVSAALSFVVEIWTLTRRAERVDRPGSRKVLRHFRGARARYLAAARPPWSA
jgi:hypothetical protein